MKIGIVNVVKPYKGSASGIIEYAYQVSKLLGRRNSVTHIYVLDKVKSNDVFGFLAAFLLLVPRVFGGARKDFDIVHVTNHEIGYAVPLFKLFGSKAKVVTTVHDLIRMRKGLHSGLIQRAFNHVVRFNIGCALKYSDFVMFDSAQTRDETLDMFRNVSENMVVPLGVDHALLARKLRPQRTSKKPFVVGYMGALAVHKNVMSIMRIANMLKQDRRKCKFLIYGKGVLHDEMLDYKRRNGLDSVEFRDIAPRTDRVKIYDSFDALIFPSLYEGFGLPVLEAQARGLPVLVYERGKVPREVKRYCLEAGDESSMAKIIRGLGSRGYDEKLRRRALAYSRSFTWERTVEEIVDVYKKVLKG